VSAQPANGSDAGALGLEARLRRLEEIVTALEVEDVDLERALALFEEGIAHVRSAEAILARTELRVEELLGSGNATPPVTRPLRSEGE
jgi:exodeoxyribonuclease VII small subunit